MLWRLCAWPLVADGVSDDTTEIDSLDHDTEFAEYVSIDDCLITSENPTDDEIIEEVMEKSVANFAHHFDEESEDNAKVEAPPQLSDAMTAVDTFQRYLCTVEDSGYPQKNLLEIESFLGQFRKQRMRQTRIGDFYR